MTAQNGTNCELTGIYVLARALCNDGKVKVSRKERLTFALVELRDRIRAEFVKVAKDWQVSSQELRRGYSYAYPVAAPGAPDPFCLEDACELAFADVSSRIVSCAESYGVPDDLLRDMLISWMISDQMGKERAPVAVFAPGLQGGANEPEGGLPSMNELLNRTCPRASGAAPGEEHEGA